MDGFTDDDGIIHDNAEYQQEGEQGNHVQSDTGPGQDKEGTEEGHGNTHADPHGQQRPQEQHQHQEHQHQATYTVLNQGFHTTLEGFRLVAPHGDFHALGEARTHLCCPLMYDLAGFQDVGPRCDIHLQIV